jgi:hypothetical protein
LTVPGLVNAVEGVLSVRAGPASGIGAPLALCIVARDGLANLSGDPR